MLTASSVEGLIDGSTANWARMHSEFAAESRIAVWNAEYRR